MRPPPARRAGAGSSPGTAATIAPATPAKWTNCATKFQCATLRLPKDYHDPAAGTLDVKIIRLPASDRAKRIGSIIVNPGGPGGSGIELVQKSAAQFPTALRERFDLVGFDPRGVNASSPVRCIDDLDGLAALDPSPDDQKELDRSVKQAKDYADACAKRNASILPYLSTDAVVDDLDQIRQAVGDEKITYLGFSYGTLIGSMYADRYPDRIRAMVLDGAIDPSLSEVQLRTGQAKAFEAALGRFLARCSRRTSCAFHEGGHSAKAFDALMAKIDKKSLPTPRVADRRRVGPGLAFSAVLGSMYNKASWPALEAGLALAKRGDGSILILLADPFRGRKANGTYSNMSDAYYANTCLDFPTSTDIGTYTKLAATLAQGGPPVPRRRVQRPAVRVLVGAVPADPGAGDRCRRAADRGRWIHRRHRDALRLGEVTREAARVGGPGDPQGRGPHVVPRQQLRQEGARRLSARSDGPEERARLHLTADTPAQVSPTSNTSPPTIRHARTPGSPVTGSAWSSLSETSTYSASG